MIRFIAEHKDHQVPGPDGGAGLRWGAEAICAVLSEHGVPISPSTYYEWASGRPTTRELRDAELARVITAQREDTKTGKFVTTLGSRKMWIRLRGRHPQSPGRVRDHRRCSGRWRAHLALAKVKESTQRSHTDPVAIGQGTVHPCPPESITDGHAGRSTLATAEMSADLSTFADTKSGP